jgi:hypothetical protein
MPAESQAQRGYLNAKFGHAWVKEHHFDNTGKLPKHVGKKAAPASRKSVKKEVGEHMDKLKKGLRT